MVRGEGRKDRRSGTFGSVDKLAKGYRARYYGPDGRRYKAPTLFLSKEDARSWLALRQSEIIRKAWEPPGLDEEGRPGRITLEAYANTWLEQRDLKIRTREHYQKLLDDHIIPQLGSYPIASITVDDVRAWHTKLNSRGTPTLRAHAYSLLRVVLGTAFSDGKIKVNPVSIRGAGSAKRVHKIRPATIDEIQIIANAMPAQYKCMTLLAAWCALRFGELAELRRSDITIVELPEQKSSSSVDSSVPEPYGIVHVRRAVVRTENGFEVTTPKSEAGIRDVEVPPHLLPAIQHHLDTLTGPKSDSLLFPAANGNHLAPATLYRGFYKARAAAKRDDLRWHDLRHSGAVFAAATGATLAELMERLGHSTPAAALRYQHAAAGRDRKIAALLSKLAAVDTPNTPTDTP
jgi:integrase